MAEPIKASDVKVEHNADGSVKITPPTGHKHKGITVLLDSDDVVRHQVGGFVDFLREHAVVGLAIGFIIGLQAQTLVKQLVDSFVTPLITLVVGPNLEYKQWVIHGSNPVTFAWGKFLYSVIDFVVVLLFIYVVVKLLKLDKFERPKVRK